MNDINWRLQICDKEKLYTLVYELEKPNDLEDYFISDPLHSYIMNLTLASSSKEKILIKFIFIHLIYMKILLI